MNRFTLALALLLTGELASAYQAIANDALMSSFVAEEGNNNADLLGEESIESELKDLFMAWTEEFDKEYETLEEMAERLLIWVNNHALIEEHNNQEPAPSYTLGHNHFSDLTQEEFRQMHFLGEFAPEFDAQKAMVQKKFPKTTDEEVSERRMLRTQMKEVPDEKSWIEEGAVTEVKNQGHCGGCWSFSTTGSIEGARFIKTGELTPLSEQMLIDCDTIKDNGCSGGLMDNAFQYDEHTKGLCSEEDYPYEAVDATCRKDSCEPVPDTQLKSFVDVDPMDVDALMAAVIINPVSVAIQASQMAFQFYAKGVFANEACGKPAYPMCKEGDDDDDDCCANSQMYEQSCFPAVDHAVLVVGYGKDEQTEKPYWLVKNSWGTSWGDKGYIRISREEVEGNDWGVCGIMSLPSYPVLM